MDNLEKPVDRICMFLDCGRKPEHLVETHTATEKESTRKTPVSQNVQAKTLLWVLTPAPLCNPFDIIYIDMYGICQALLIHSDSQKCSDITINKYVHIITD